MKCYLKELELNVVVVESKIKDVNVLVGTPIGIVPVPLTDYFVDFVETPKEFFDTNTMVNEALIEVQAHIDKIKERPKKKHPLDELIEQLKESLKMSV